MSTRRSASNVQLPISNETAHAGNGRSGVGGYSLAFVIVASVACASVACGKKGPPLTPLVPIPAAVEPIEATRLGNTAYVTFTVPAENVDEYTPADLARVEVYGYTGRAAPPVARWVEVAGLVATVPVAPAPKPGEEAADAPVSRVHEAPQGARVTITDALTPDELVQGKELSAARPAQPAPRDAEGAQAVERAERAAAVPLKRFYLAVPFNARGRPGPPGAVAEFPLLPVPDPPPSLNAAYTERAIVVRWQPSGGLLGFLLERPLPEEPVPFVDEELERDLIAQNAPAAPLSYFVYREVLPDAMAPPPAPEAGWRVELPAPLTPVPLPNLAFTDAIEFERRRCYSVRAVRGAGPEARVGEASSEACVTPIDVFPPAPPRSLAAVASESAISLIWEPNTEVDLGGYIVLRGQAGGDTLRPLSKAPVLEAGYRDETVTPGVRYVYAVVAVDNRVPMPNISLESSRVEETAR